SGSTRQGRLGIGGAMVAAAHDVAPAAEASLDLAGVDAAFERIATASGAGSAAGKAQALRDLMARATREEQDFLVRLLFGELRQGALEGVLVEAGARASSIPVARIRRAAMLAGALAPVARAAIVDGEPALARFMFQLFQPVQPMLADAAADIDAALAEL